MNSAQMLAYEKATLGFYVTAHPLSQHADELEKYKTADTVDLGALPEDAEVVLGGMIARARTTVTKSGRNAGAKMAFVTLEDFKGSVEAVIFPGDFERYRAVIKPEVVVFLRGRVDRRREQPSLRVSEVVGLGEADEKLTAKVMLRINCSVADAATLDELGALCRAHPGECPLYLEMSTPDGWQVIIGCNGEGGAICPDAEFIEQAARLLGGREHVVLIGQPKRAQPEVSPPEPVEVEAQDVVEEEALL